MQTFVFWAQSFGRFGHIWGSANLPRKDWFEISQLFITQNQNWKKESVLWKKLPTHVFEFEIENFEQLGRKFEVEILELIKIKKLIIYKDQPYQKWLFDYLWITNLVSAPYKVWHWKAGWVDGWVFGWMGEWIDGWMDGWK